MPVALQYLFLSDQDIRQPSTPVLQSRPAVSDQDRLVKTKPNKRQNRNFRSCFCNNCTTLQLDPHQLGQSIETDLTEKICD